VIEKADSSDVAKNLMEEAVLLAYDMAAKENCLGMYLRVQQAVKAHFNAKRSTIPVALSGSSKINEARMQNEY
jgi:hypothetical protein